MELPKYLKIVAERFGFTITEELPKSEYLAICDEMFPLSDTDVLMFTRGKTPYVLYLGKQYRIEWDFTPTIEPFSN